MQIKPKLESVSRFHGTIFDQLSLGANWNEKDQSYYFAIARLTHYPSRIDGNPDRRFYPTVVDLGFQEFCTMVKEALDSEKRFRKFLESLPENTAEASQAISERLTMRHDGIYITAWPWASIIDQRQSSPKVAALCVMEILQLEANLPVDKV